MLRVKEQGDGGVILNTASVAGLVGWGGTVYGATKGGVIRLTRGVAIEAAPFGIRVNAICPAAMPCTGSGRRRHTGRRGTRTGRRSRRPSVDGHPLGKPIRAEDCAEAAVFLCSDRVPNITGILMPVDGGYVAR